MKQDRHGTIEQVREVWKHWQTAPDKIRSTQAMVKIDMILREYEKREERLRTIAEDARRDRELMDGGE